VWSNPLRNPLWFLTLLTLLQSIFLWPEPEAWGWLLAAQVAVCLVALAFRGWRLYGLVALAILVGSNWAWVTSPGIETCQSSISSIEGWSRQGYQKGIRQIELIRPRLQCGNQELYLAMVQVETNLPAQGWFQAGDQIRFERVELQDDRGLPRFRAFPKVFNLSSQAHQLGRSPLLLYLQSKARLYLSPKALAFFKALGTADRSDLSSLWRRHLGQMGLAHLLAISGMHVGALFLWVNLGLRAIGSFHVKWILEGKGLLWVDLLTLALVFGFLQLIDSPVSARRAWAMLAWWVAIKHFLPAQPLWLVLLGVGQYILLSEPWALMQVSFQLSFLSVGGIFIILPLLPRIGLWQGAIRRFIGALWSSFLMSCWLFIFTLPLVDRIQPIHSLISPINNLIHIFWVGSVMMPGYLLVLSFASLSYVCGGLVGEAWVFELAEWLGQSWQILLDLTWAINNWFLVRLDWQLKAPWITLWTFGWAVVIRAAIYFRKAPALMKTS